MRYEDASQTDSLSNELPVARDDSDALAAGARGPATGNVITGEGTQTGSVGADVLTTGAQITAIEGAGGSDSDLAGGKLNVTGEFGKLSIDAQGNYSYLADQGAPETARDYFTYRLTDAAGNSDSARLMIEIGKTQAQVATQQVVVGPDGVVVLPAGVTLNDIRVVGRDLVVTLPDGSQMVIKDGAVFVPQLVLDNVEIPATNLAALLIDSEPRPAAGGQPPSSGGNFAVPVGPLDPGVPLGDLIPPTELDYTPPDFIDVGIEVQNRAPFASDSAVNVSEEGLVGGLADTVGTPDTTNSASVLNGSILAGDPDGDMLTITLGIPTQALESRDVPIVWALSAGGTVLTGSAGGTPVIVVTMQSNGQYSVVLSRQIDHPVGGTTEAAEDGVTFIIPVNVSDGEDFLDVAITVIIEDDSPRLGDGRTGSSVLLDETDGANPLSSGAPIVATSAAAMIGAPISYGADGQGPAPVYSLSLLGGVNSLVSNVQTALGDFPITLTLTNSTLITATYQSGGTQTAFTIRMNANGTVTVTQFAALEHLVDGPPGPAHDDALTLNSTALGNLINASVTFRDFDGDSVTATNAIGNAITFEDDGPSIAIVATIPTDQEGQASLVLTTGDDGTEGVGSTTDSTSANFGGVFRLGVSDGGADGAAGTPALGYSLNLLVVEGTDSNFDSNGQTIFLYNVGGIVVGSTSAVEPATATHASVVFALSVNGTGVVTLTQYQQIDHVLQAAPNAAPFTDQFAVLGTGLVELVATASIIDNDGDTDNDTERFDLGGYVRFADDGPDISAVLTGTQIRIDETDGVVALGGETDTLVDGHLGTVTVAAATLFTVSNPGISADAPTTLSYAFTVTDGANSGLLLSTTNAPIFLYITGNTVTGSTSINEAGIVTGNTAFTATINPGTGAVTLTQFLAVEHPVGGASHDEDSSGLTAGVLTISVTATDFDGDTDSASVDLGSVIRFEDDGPAIDVTASATLEPTIRLTTGDAGTEGEGSTSDFTASGNFGGVFGLTFTTGSDGGTTPSLSFTLGTTGGASGLFSHGVAINLYNVGGIIVGSTLGVAPATATAASVVFAVSVNASGVVTLTQYQQIDHPLEAAPNAFPFADQLISLLNDASITLTASSNITDNDNDTASDSATINIGANLRFADDGPTITQGPTLGSSVTLDETAGASPLSSGSPISATSALPMISAAVNYGADGQGPAPVFGLSLLGTAVIGTSIASGLATAQGDFLITLTLTSTTLITATYQDGGTKTAFTIQMNANGTVTVTQFTALEHLIDGPLPSDHDDSLDLDNALGNLVNATVTYRDFDGDTATATVAIGAAITFKDDGPNAALADVATDILVLDESPVGTETDGDSDPVGRATITAEFGNNFAAPDYGADGEGSVSYALILTGSNVASGLFALGVNGAQGASIVLNQNLLTGVITGSAGGTPYFTISVDGDGTVSFTQLGNVYHANTATDDDTSSLTVAQGVLVIEQTVTDADGDFDSESIDLGNGIFQIEDDGPNSELAAGQVPDVMVLDESPLLQDEGGDFDPAGRSLITAEFADNFEVTVDYGTDGAGTTTYSFVLNGTDVPSGLFALEPGDRETVIDPFGRGAEIVLNQSGNTITGSAGGTPYFTIVINADSGQVTFTQLNPIWHGNTGSDDDTATLTAALGSLFVRQTVTDRDGDSDFAQIDVSRNVFQIEDDGPKLVTGNGGTTVDEDELPGGITDGDGVSFSNTGSLFGLVDFGEDGSGGFSFDATLLAGLPAILSGGATVNYAVSPNGLTLTAYTGGNPALNTVFTVVITNPATGAYTFTLSEQLDHVGPLVSGTGDNQLLSLNLSSAVVARDGDGDPVVLTGGFVVTVEDDIPTVNAQIDLGGAVTVDESAPVDDSTISFGTTTFVKGNDPHLEGGLAIGKATGTTGIVDGNALFGADGAKAGVNPVYSLSVTNATSGLFTTEGVAITLVRLDNGVVVGQVGATTTVAFAVSIDPATGVITVEQYLSLKHPDFPNNYDEAVPLGGNTLGVVVTATDFDNDVATSPAVDISAQVQFKDDGPTIDVTKGNDDGVVLTTFDALTIGSASNFAESATNFGGVFGLTFNGGADGAVAPTLGYTLNVAALSSGLASGGQPINLYKVGAVVVGTTGGQPADLNDPLIVFTVQVSATGVVRVTQFQQIDHTPEASPIPGTGSPFDDQFATLVEGKITLTASSTITDGDLDTATNSETVDLGGNIRFADHGPIAAPDTDSIASGGSSATGNVITDASAGDLTPEDTDNGADTAGADAPIRVISGDNTQNVTLPQDVPNGGFVDIIGQYGTLRLFSNGDYTYTRNGALGGGESETFQYTIRDFDGDTATSTLTIGIDNATPSAGTVTIKLDDDAVIGADGNPAGPGDDINFEVSSATLPGLGGDGPLTWTFALLVDQPLLPAGFNYGIVDADTIQIRQGTTPVFTIQITNATTGAYTVTQNAPILHGANEGGVANFENNIDFLGIKYVVTDVDNDTAVGTININVDDDTPVVGINVSGLNVVHDETVGVQPDTDFNGTLTVFNNVTTKGEDLDVAGTGAIGFAIDIGAITTTGSAPGADGGTTTISLVTVNGTNSGITTSEGAAILLYNETVDGQAVVVGRVGGSGGVAAFAIHVNQSGDVSIVQYLSVTQPTQLLSYDEPVSLANNVLFARVTVTDNDGDTVSTPLTSIGQLISFQDDGPLAVNDGTLLDPIIQPTQNVAFTINALANDAFGSDGVVTTDAAKVFVSTQATQGTVTYNPLNGLFTYTPGTEAGSTSTADSFQYTIVDRDGDISVATVFIRLQPDSTPNATDEAAAVDDDGLLGGTAELGNGNPNSNLNDLATNSGDDTTLSEAVFTGQFNVDFGADTPGSFSFSQSLESLTPTVGTESVTYTVSDNGLLLTATGPRGPLFTVEITNAATGTYTVTLLDNVQHLPRTGETDDNTENLPLNDATVTIAFTATDSGSSDSTTGNLIITFDDDMPSVNSASNVTLTNGLTSSTGTFDFAIGADDAFDPYNASSFLTTTVTGSVSGQPITVTSPPTYTGTNADGVATYAFAFTYDADPGAAVDTKVNSGTINFDIDDGTYTVTIAQPISGFSTSQTSNVLDRDGYNLEGTPQQSEIVVSQLNSPTPLFIQFTGDAATNSSPLVAGGDGTFVNGETFTTAQTFVSISNTDNGVAGDTIQGGEVLDFNLFTSDPGGVITSPTPANQFQATGLTIRLDGVGSTEDFIVVLKLYNTVSGAYTTQAIIVGAEDVYRSGSAIPAAYNPALATPAKPLDNNDGLVIIEANDYLLSNPDTVIVGAQLLSSTEGVSGSGLALNGTTGAGGGSTTTQLFGNVDNATTDATNDQDVVKISDIGITQVVTTPQSLLLDFTVNLTDSDGDTVIQHLLVNPPPPAVMAAATMEFSQEPANDTFSMSLLSTESADSQLQKTAANNNSGVIAAAVAAAGLASSQAAAQSETSATESDAATFDAGQGKPAKFIANDNDGVADTGRSLMSNESRVSADDGEEVSSFATFDTQSTAQLDETSSTQDAPTELLAGTDAADGNGAAASMVAPMIVMPSAEALEAMGNGQSGGQHNTVVGKVIAEALEGGGGGGQIDGLLAGLAGGGNGGNPVLDALAIQNGGAVSGWDMGNGGSFQADLLVKVVAEAMMLHHDAVQPAING